MADLLSSFNSWKILLTTPTSIHAIMGFLNLHPDWPCQEKLLEKLETALTGTEPGLLDWFHKFKPITPEGAFIYANLLVLEGKHEVAKKLVKEIWSEKAFSGTLAKKFRSTFADFLNAGDDFNRASFLLYDGNMGAAEELLPNLSPIHQDIIKARLALMRGNKNATKQAEDTCVGAKSPPSLIFSMVNFYRSQKTDSGNQECLRLLNDDAIADEESHFAEKWWNERNILARRMIEEKKYEEAAKLIERHKLTKGEQYANAEWILGWLYLQYLNRPLEAKNRFQKLYENVSSPISKSRMAFWMGETLKILGENTGSIQWYEKAAHYGLTFYGQLAISRLRARGHGGNILLEETQPSFEIKKQFQNREFVKLLKSIYKTEADEHVLPFFLKLADSISNPTEQSLLVDFALSHGNAYKAVLMCKKVSRTQIPNTPNCFPELKKKTKHIVEKINTHTFFQAFVHAIIRQESRFDAKATSSANAMGLMQVIQKTAQDEMTRAKTYGISVPLRQSLYHEEKNVMLGTFHILHLLDKFDGSLVLAIAAYNAGPKPVNDWIEQFGDPRLATTNLLNWIENIPFGETRNYVQRVMENLMVYLHKLNKGTQYDLATLLAQKMEGPFLHAQPQNRKGKS
jgi:soluble lytic murein transglycosylase